MCCILHSKVIDRVNPSRHILECYSPNNCNETVSNQQHDVKVESIKIQYEAVSFRFILEKNMFISLLNFIFWNRHKNLDSFIHRSIK